LKIEKGVIKWSDGQKNKTSSSLNHFISCKYLITSAIAGAVFLFDGSRIKLFIHNFHK
jgi:hypothetical protein